MSCLKIAGVMMIATLSAAGQEHASRDEGYLARVERCIDLLVRHGTDRYGKIQTPILVSILDVESRTCPENPLELDEKWRVTRRG